MSSHVQVLSINPDQGSIVEAPDTNSLFSYTSGRFLFNETLRLKERHVEFNVGALQLAAEKANNTHGKTVGITKLAEGGFNRVFTIQFQDGFEMIAKIQYHLVEPKYFATASEAATLTFLRSEGIPVPEVYGYCASADNPVGAEYILMEKAAGDCLVSKWEDLNDSEIRQLAYSFVQLERKLFKLPFSATGSLYFKTEIDAGLQVPLYKEQAANQNSQFCIGPIADYMFWYGKRVGLDLDRGPWTSPVDYLQSIAKKEVKWTMNHGKSMEPDFPYNAIGLGIQHPNDYLKLLNDYQKLAPYLLPRDTTHPFNQPILRHPLKAQTTHRTCNPVSRNFQKIYPIYWNRRERQRSSSIAGICFSLPIMRLTVIITRNTLRL